MPDSDAPRLFHGNEAVYNPKIAGGRQGGVAAEFPEVQLFNPAASGIVMYIEKILIGTGLAGSSMDILWQLGQAELATALLDRSARDKVPAVEAVVANPRVDTNAAAPLAGPVRTRVEDIPRIVPLGLWFPAGEGMTFRGNLANGTLIFTWYWYEIPELSFTEFEP